MRRRPVYELHRRACRRCRDRPDRGSQSPQLAMKAAFINVRNSIVPTRAKNQPTHLGQAATTPVSSKLLLMAFAALFVTERCCGDQGAARRDYDRAQLKRSLFHEKVSFLDESRQLIVVKTQGWNSTPALMQLFERSRVGEVWTPASPAYPAVVGGNGVAWGIGLHSNPADGHALKKEGDGRSPAGVFSLSRIYGYAPAEETRSLKFSYLQINDRFEG